MTICQFGWWRNTTPMWTSMTCGPGRRSRCRAWRSSIASNAAIAQVSGEDRAGIERGRKSHDGSVRRTNIEFELWARCHAADALNGEVEVRGLAPRSGLPVRAAPELRRLG